MEIQRQAYIFLNKLVDYIEKKDKLHWKKINSNIFYLKENYPIQFEELVWLVQDYFIDSNMTADRIADDYLKMIRDMRIEGLYFHKYLKYRCENQDMANEFVYSKPEVMRYYMNALLLSQIMWKHHFNLFMYFSRNISTLFKNYQNLNILDVGPGHGFFSFLIKKEFPDYGRIDFVDISDTSLEMTKKIIGFDQGKINYYWEDIFEFEETTKYDLIVLGEVLEHLDEPKKILLKLSKLLNTKGYLWISTPTNSPAIDHVYLFNSKEEILTLIEETNLRTVDFCNYFAEDTDEQVAFKNKTTNLVGLFCKVQGS